MPDHLTIRHAVAFVERHGYMLLFFWVLAEQSAIPLPSIPLLLAAGALIHTGQLHALPAIVSCVMADLIADTLWFSLGRLRGPRVLHFLCRVSLEPDSCVRRTENVFLKYGMNSLLVSKFIPGLNAVAAPLAGNSHRPYTRFLFFDGLGALIWSAAYLALGYLFSERLEDIGSYASRLGSGLLLLVLALFALWIGWKFVQRRRFLKQLDVARITPEELRERLTAGEDLFIVDLRSRLPEYPDLIPGALRVSPDELAARGLELPRDREIVLACS
jgi:membrane protein DedA with SNARE-associated domain